MQDKKQPAVRPPQPINLLPGSSGKYKVLRLLAQGGFASVYTAVRLVDNNSDEPRSDEDKEVAIKVRLTRGMHACTGVMLVDFCRKQNSRGVAATESDD